MTTQPELPDLAVLPGAPVLRLAPPLDAPDVDFDSFVRRYGLRLRRLVMRRLGDLCESEEITQETLLRAYQHRGSFRSEDELMAWSTVVAQRLVIDRVRVRGRSVSVADVPESARLGRDTADIVVARHEARAALESLEAIPTRQAAILWAREVEGLHYEEIAERFDITEPAVRSLLHRGRKALRKEFKDRTGSVPLNGLVPFAPWLLALKAAGKLRGAAKTVVKSPVAMAATLSLSGLLALTIGAGIGGHARDVRIVTSPGGATHVETLVAASGDAAATDTAHRRGYVAPSAGGTRPWAGVPGPITTLPLPDCDAPESGHTPSSAVLSQVGSISKDPPPKACHSTLGPSTFWIGPDLPPNPTPYKRVGVSQDFVSCSNFYAQGGSPTPLVSCSDGSKDPAPAPVPLPHGTSPHAPSAPEGADR